MFSSNAQQHSDVCVVGGGIVGLAVGLGLLRNGLSVTILDEGDHALRASRGNFGLVWVQGKGDIQPAYRKISRCSAALWPSLAKELKNETGIDVELQQKGGLFLCLSEQELADRQAMLMKMRDDAGGDYPFSILNLKEAREFLPDLGPEVAGATWCPEDGHLNPLHFLRALNELFIKRGGKLVHQGRVVSIDHKGTTFDIKTDQKASFSSQKVVLAAGLGSRDLAPMVGLNAPVVPNRGQVLITERLMPFISYPTGHVRQTEDGTVQIGDSKEDVGFDKGTSTEVLAQIAARARKLFPILKDVKLVRAWGALRIMTPDGIPIYEESKSCPGAYLVTCHSGVTLGAFHEGPMANWISGKEEALITEAFHASRFQV